VSAVAGKNTRTAIGMALFAAAMLGLAFASVPLYRLFCQATGFAGTTQRAERAPGAVAGQIGVRFDANVHPGLAWKFEPVQRTVRVAPGARTQIFYRAQNLTARTITGQAVFNVSPDTAGKYFKKIACFCFTEQTLKPGQTVDMPVVFFVDPAIRQDPDAKDIDEITLSYTFYPVES
jgi:cytochrome c oxidase assembly protein subunit 11